MEEKKYKFTIIALILLLLVATPGGIVSANHVCSGDPEVDAGTNAAEGHDCVPASSGGGKTTTFSGLLGKISSAVDSLVPFIIGLAVLVIIWGIFNYLVRAADEEKRADAKKYIIWGIIGVFFMVSIWGFVNILLNTFDLKRTIDTADIPKVPTIGGGNGNVGDCPNGGIRNAGGNCP